MGASSLPAEDQAQALRALEEIERLIAEAATGGLKLDPWVFELAEELRATLPELDSAEAAAVAANLVRNRDRSLAAQGRRAVQTLRALAR